MSRIVVAGASGLIGVPLVGALRSAGHDVEVLVRREPRAAGEFHWDPAAGELDPAVLEGADAVINLSGASIARIPWTTGYQRELVASRIGPTRLLAETMAGMSSPPATFLSGSAIGFYGNRPRVRLDDDSPRGDGFLADLVLAWEQAAALAPPATRVVNLRTGVVVARSGGMAPVRLLTTFLLGSRFLPGTQYWPWISLDDEVRAIRHVIDGDLAGPVNLAGPTRATANDLGFALARALNRPFLVRAPAWGMKLALGRDATEAILTADMNVVPARLEASGFVFTHPTVEDAVRVAVADITADSAA